MATNSKIVATKSKIMATKSKAVATKSKAVATDLNPPPGRADQLSQSFVALGLSPDRDLRICGKLWSGSSTPLEVAGKWNIYGIL
ncbi:hypothetical protein HGM15179_017950 [Zosterops borbonicus]|uniref:Uncharacterized protein n=1 Tax=Zosterops borbonicus TaxID=364589 RepID=A0A8K1LCS5_9PASS|nr:hypothetical protein HGM15179_017950 [Zosterops borbonicus]